MFCGFDFVLFTQHTGKSSVFEDMTSDALGLCAVDVSHAMC